MEHIPGALLLHEICETQLIAEEDYKTHTFALLTMVIALCTIKHL